MLDSSTSHEGLLCVLYSCEPLLALLLVLSQELRQGSAADAACHSHARQAGRLLRQE